MLYVFFAHFVFAHFGFQLPPVPPDFSQLGQWVIMPTVLTFLANLVINDFFSKESPQRQALVKFGTFILIGLLGFGLTKLPADFVAGIQPLWVILASVIAAYYAPTVIRQVWTGIQRFGQALFAIALGLAFGRTLGHDSFKAFIAH